MTRTATAAGVTGSRDFGDSCKFARSDLVFNRTFRDEEARADERLVANPFIARRITELANRLQQRVTRKLRAMLSAGFTELFTPKCVTILPDDGSLGSRNI